MINFTAFMAALIVSCCVSDVKRDGLVFTFLTESSG